MTDDEGRAHSGPAFVERVRPSSDRRRRRLRWIFPAVTVAALMALAVVAAIGEFGGSPDRSVGGPSARDSSAGPGAASPLIGHDWRLVKLRPADGDAFDAVTAAPFRISDEGGDATVRISDGCASASGPIDVVGSSLVFGELAVPGIGCVDRSAGFTMQRELIGNVIAGGPVQWTVRADILTLYRPEVGELTYARVAGPPSPTAVFSGKRVLVTIQSAPTGTSPDGSVSARPAPDGAYVGWRDGTLSGSSGCHDFRGNYTIDGDALTVTNFGFVDDKPCPQQYFWPVILDGTTHWAADDGRLTITASDGSALFFAPAGRDSARRLFGR